MKKHILKIVVVFESILLMVAVIFLSAYIYDAAKFNPNRYSRGKVFYTVPSAIDIMTKYCLPMFDSVELDFIETNALFRNDYIVAGLVRKHAEQGDGYVFMDVGGRIVNGKCPENELEWYLRQGAARQEWFRDVDETSEAALWDALSEEAADTNFYAFFKVNGNFRLDGVTGEFYQALCEDSEFAEPPEIEWAGKALPGTDFMFGTPLGRRVRPMQGGSKLNVWIFANMILQNPEDELKNWLFGTGLFGDLSNADFSKFLEDPFNMDAVMICGDKDVIAKYQGNSVLTLAYYSKSKV